MPLSLVNICYPPFLAQGKGCPSWIHARPAEFINSPDPMPVSVSVYTGHTLQCTLCIHWSGASGAPVQLDTELLCQCMPSVPSVYPVYPVYTCSVRPVYTNYTEPGSGQEVVIIYNIFASARNIGFFSNLMSGVEDTDFSTDIYLNGILEQLDAGPGLWTPKGWTLDRDFRKSRLKNTQNFPAIATNFVCFWAEISVQSPAFPGPKCRSSVQRFQNAYFNIVCRFLPVIKFSQ